MFGVNFIIFGMVTFEKLVKIYLTLKVLQNDLNVLVSTSNLKFT